MPDHPALKLSETRRPRNSLVAASILVAIAAVLIGFHSVTMVLSAMSLGAGAEQTAKVTASRAVREIPLPTRGEAPAATISAPAVVSAPAASAPAPADAPQPATLEPPNGSAAAAKANAQAEMDQFGGESAELPDPAPRRRYRTPRVELHKVY